MQVEEKMNLHKSNFEYIQLIKINLLWEGLQLVSKTNCLSRQFLLNYFKTSKYESCVHVLNLLKFVCREGEAQLQLVEQT